MKLLVATPHFAPDVAPTGDVATRLVEELGRRGHELEVVTSLPWYREHKVEPRYDGRLFRYEDTPWGRITRVHPLATSDKRNIALRAASFGGFTTCATLLSSRGGELDGILALSPPLTLGLSGWTISRLRGGAFVFNVQDVYPDVAIQLGVLSNRPLIDVAGRIERFCYMRADAVTVLSEDVRENVAQKLNDTSKVHVVPNFVDTAWIKPEPKDNAYRREFGLEDKIVVMYAGNVGLSQSLDLIIDAASALSYERDLVFVINGQGAARPLLEERARGLSNVRFVDMQPSERLPQVLAAADVHVVPLRRGLARSSVPSKTYSILAAGRPLVASVDPGSEIARIVERAGAGVSVPPEDPEAFAKAVRHLVESPEEARRMGEAGRRFIEGWASPAAVAEAYESLFEDLADRRRATSAAG